MSIGDNIKKIRKLKGLKQSELAKLSDVSRVAIGNYERGDRTPNIDILNKIANALMVNIDILLYWTDNIVICEDVLTFISNLYPEEYYDFDTTLDSLGKILNLKKDDPELIQFLYGTSNNKKLYKSFSDAVGLTSKQIYNWILSNTLFSLLESHSLNPANYTNLLRKIIKENILTDQNIDDLLSNGLSAENKDKFNMYIDNTNLKSIGDNIKRFRKLEGLTQKQLSDLIDEPITMIRKYENNDVRVPMDILYKISKALKTPMVMFLNNIAAKRGEDPNYTEIWSFADNPEYFKFIESLENENINKNMNNNFVEEISELLENQVSEERLQKLSPKINLINPILDSYGIKLSLSNDKKFITMDIPNKDIYKDIYLDDFLNFIDKIYWGIEREIDYLEHLYD